MPGLKKIGVTLALFISLILGLAAASIAVNSVEHMRDPPTSAQ